MKFKVGDRVRCKKTLKLPSYAQTALRRDAKIIRIINSGNKYVVIKLPNYPTIWVDVKNLEPIKNTQVLFNFMEQ